MYMMLMANVIYCVEMHGIVRIVVDLVVFVIVLEILSFYLG